MGIQPRRAWFASPLAVGRRGLVPNLFDVAVFAILAGFGGACGAREKNPPLAQPSITPLALVLKLLSSNPRRMVADLAVDLPQPGNRVDRKFRQLVDAIYARMTERPTGKPGQEGIFPGTGIALMLPRVSPNVLAGLMEAIAADPYNGRADPPALAASLQMEIEDLFQVADRLHLLGFTEVADGDISLADEGQRFVLGGFDERKGLFAQHVLTSIPLAAHIKHVLDECASHRVHASRFGDELEDHMSEEDAEQTLRASSRSPGTSKLLPTTKAATP
jgi:NitT/TauT family transport system ATP-binding protein